jgi:asparagine synthase (glutamine-hydrolysing)
MCGILRFSGSFAPAALRAGLNAIAHRGPDDSGQFFDGLAGVGLGHVRLSIIDLSPLGHQPMVDSSGSLVIVFNGEIYNFQELRVQLESEGYIFRSQSDTEVLLALYQVHGEAMLPLLNGIFAFAIYERAEQTIFLACDAISVKPLYFTEGRNGFAFASELKGLVALADVAGSLRRLDRDRVDDRLGQSVRRVPGEEERGQGWARCPPLALGAFSVGR